VSSGVVVKRKMYDLITDSQQLPPQFNNTNYSLFGMEQQQELHNYNAVLHPIKV